MLCLLKYMHRDLSAAPKYCNCNYQLAACKQNIAMGNDIQLNTAEACSRPGCLCETFRWQAASQLAKRLGLFSRGSAKSQGQRKWRSSVIAHSLRKVSSHLHRHRHSESLMTSYLRMQAAAAAAEPKATGIEGQTDRGKDRQCGGHDLGQLKRQHDGQLIRQTDGPDTETCCPGATAACSVDIQSLQVSAYSLTLRESGLQGVGSGLLHGEQRRTAGVRYSTSLIGFPR